MRLFRSAFRTEVTASLEISDSRSIHSSSSRRSSRTFPCLMTRPPCSTIPPPRSMETEPVSVSISALFVDPRGAAFTSTSWRPVVVRIIERSTFEPFGFAMVVAFRRFNSFARCFSNLSRRLRSFFESVTGREMSSSSSSQSSQSSSEDSSGVSTICSSSMSRVSSSQSSSTCLDDSRAAMPSSESSIAVRASESTSSATSLTRFLNRSKRPMFSPSRPELIRYRTCRLCDALVWRPGGLLILAAAQFPPLARVVRFDSGLPLLQ